MNPRWKAEQLPDGTTTAPVSLNRGSTWYEIVPTGAAVSY
jgi:hypothetical protein